MNLCVSKSEAPEKGADHPFVIKSNHLRHVPSFLLRMFVLVESTHRHDVLHLVELACDRRACRRRYGSRKRCALRQRLIGYPILVGHPTLLNSSHWHSYCLIPEHTRDQAHSDCPDRRVGQAVTGTHDLEEGASPSESAASASAMNLCSNAKLNCNHHDEFPESAAEAAISGNRVRRLLSFLPSFILRSSSQ